MSKNAIKFWCKLGFHTWAGEYSKRGYGWIPKHCVCCKIWVEDTHWELR